MTSHSLVATAPGKVMLAGEYAVIDGAETVLIAVNRRVRAEDAGTEQRQSPFLQAVRNAAAAFGGDADRAGRVVVNSDALAAEGGTKLGLGSSAAVTVAAAALALGGNATPDAIHGLAHRAHRAAQGLLGAKGSGADIAASVRGGVIAARVGPDGPDAPMVTRQLALPLALHLVFVWTGQAADTASLVAQVRRLRTSDAAAYEAAIRAIADAATELCTSMHADADPMHAIAAVAAGGQAVAALGARAGVTLESPLHRALSRRAEQLGGASKPTGAGAGDILVAAFASQSTADTFRTAVEADGIHCPPLRVDPRGTAFE